MREPNAKASNNENIYCILLEKKREALGLLHLG